MSRGPYSRWDYEVIYGMMDTEKHMPNTNETNVDFYALHFTLYRLHLGLSLDCKLSQKNIVGLLGAHGLAKNTNKEKYFIL